MPSYRGTHGTTRTRAENISKEGFTAKVGERGTGAYFWRENVYAVPLAVGWYQNQLNRGEYGTDRDKRCSVVKASINVASDTLIDLEDPDIKDDFLRYFLEKGVEDSRNAGKIYDMFLEMLEEESGKKLALVITQVFTNKWQKYPNQTAGMAYCYLVRDLRCITVDDVVHYDEGLKLCGTVNLSKNAQKMYSENYLQ